MSEGLKKVKSFFSGPKMPAPVATEQKVERMPVIDDTRTRMAGMRERARLSKEGGRDSTILTGQKTMGSQSPAQTRSGLAASSVITG